MPPPQGKGNNGTAFAITDYTDGVVTGTASEDYGDLLYVIRDVDGNIVWQGTVATTYDGTNFSADLATALNGAGISLAGGDYTVTASYDETNKNGKTTKTVTTEPHSYTVEGANTPPSAVDDTVVIDEDASGSGNLLDNDGDAENDTLSITGFVIAGDPSSYGAGELATISGVGELRINADGTWTFTPDADWSGAVPQVTYTVSDGTDSSTAALNISVTAVNDAPLAVGDSATVAEDTTASGNVLDNDSDVENDGLSITGFVVAGDPGSYLAGESATISGVGVLTLNADGTWIFTPDGDWNGTVPQVTYTVSDGTDSSTAALNISVTAVNDAPLAVGDSATVAEDTTASGNVLDNDSDVENDGLSITGFVVAGDPGSYLAGESATISGVGVLTLNADGTWIFTPDADWNGTVPQVTYTVSDGTDSSTATLDVTVDAVNDPPVAGDDTATTTEGDPVTITVLGNDDDVEGDSLAVSIDTQAQNGTAVANPDGTITYTPGAGFSGTDTFTYQVDDGNGGIDTATVTVTVDPALDTTAPTGSTPDLLPGSDSGTSDTDNVTNVALASFRVQLDATVRVDDTIELLIDGQADVSHDVTQADLDSGYVDLTTTSTALAEGANQVAARLYDPAGNSTTTGALTVTFDSTTPQAGTPDLVDASDSGTSASDDITNVGAATFAVALTAAAAGDLLVLKVDGVEAASRILDDADISAGSVELTVGDLGASGAKSITAEIGDAAGNASTSGTLAIQYDADAPTGGTPNLVQASDSGTSDSDNLTNASETVFRVALDGTVVEGDVLTLLIDGSDGPTHTVSAADIDAGYVDIAASGLAEGGRSISARFEDAAGNSSTSGSLSVTIDRSAPAAPSAPDLAAASDTGDSATDDLTADATPTLSGTAEANATITIHEGGSALGQTTADGSGNWSITLAALADGAHALTATATDAAGNESAASSALTLTVDTGIDTATIGGLTADDGAPDGDGVTGDTTPTIAGTAEVGATVELFLDGGGSLGSTTASDGSWSIEASALGHGSHTVHAVVTDAAGNSTTTGTYTFSIDDQVDVAEITGIADDTGTAGDNITSDSTPLITGNAEPGSTVTVYPVTGGDLGTGFAATVDPDGSWSADPGTLPDGVHTFRALVTDGYGNTAWTGDLTVTVDTAIVDAAITEMLVDDGGSEDVLPVPSGSTTSDTSPLLRGTAEQLALIEIFVDDTLVGSTTADANGDWEFGLSGLGEGTHTITVATSDAAGNTGGGNSFEITVDPPASTGPTDSLYAEQWHLAALGGADPTASWTDYSRFEAIVQDYSGAGVLVGIYDDGIEYTHTDLAPNYSTAAHLVWNSTELDPYPTSGSEAVHGTAVAGVIAAAANGQGTVGVAWGATLSGVNIFSGAANINSSTPDGFEYAAGELYRYDISNHSWGAAPTYLNDTNAAILAFVAGVDTAVDTGRGGLGSIVLKAAGNWSDSAQGDLGDATRQTITVAAYDSDGDASWYSNRGANILGSAPASGNTIVEANGDGTLAPESDLRIATTDREGSFGYSPDSWSSSTDTTGFGGTSSATPAVSGVVALMLEANPTLGWRDVQNILAYSARETGSETGVQNTETEVVPVDLDSNGTFETTAERPVEWYPGQWNGARDWNGGGHHVSMAYGHGAVDAYNAVRMAEVWSLFEPAAQVSDNEAQGTTGLMSPNLSVSGNGSSNTDTFTVSGVDMELEYVDISVNLNTLLMQEVMLEIESPSGTRATLLDVPLNDYTPAYDFLGLILLRVNVTWTFGAHTFKGEDPNGVWKVHLTEKDVTFDVDNYGSEADGNTLVDLQLDFYGKAADADDVYHYTDEMVTLGLNDPRPAHDPVADRVSLSDDDGGTDWLNMAAMSFDLDVDLTAGVTAQTASGPEAVAAFATDMLENAVTGDGDDRLTGNSLANELHGMRGNDELSGGLGDDRLAGGDGLDTFFFARGDGNDWILDFSDGQDLVSLENFASTDLVFQESGDDTVLTFAGSAGDSITFASVGTDALGLEDFLFSTA